MEIDLIVGEGCTTSVSNVEGLVVDLSVIIHTQAAITPKGKTFDDFSSQILQNIADTATRQNASRNRHCGRSIQPKKYQISYSSRKKSQKFWSPNGSQGEYYHP